MRESSFDALARRYFGEILEPQGFSCLKSRYATFSRQVSDDIFHFILPDISGGGTWYDVKVFASSPKIEPEFDKRFPDEIGIPSGSLCYLHPVTGVGADQKHYPCKTEEVFMKGFTSAVSSALRSKALPYLDEITSLQTLSSNIHHDFYLGLALWHMGDKDAARRILGKEEARLSDIQDDTGRVSVLLGHIRGLQWE